MIGKVCKLPPDYVYWQGTVNVVRNGVTYPWYARKWKSGLVDTWIRVMYANTSPLQYTSLYGVHYCEIFTDGIPIPFMFDTNDLYYSVVPTQLRLSMSMQSASAGNGGINHIRLWSPSTEPFSSTGTTLGTFFIRFTGRLLS